MDELCHLLKVFLASSAYCFFHFRFGKARRCCVVFSDMRFWRMLDLSPNGFTTGTRSLSILLLLMVACTPLFLNRPWMPLVSSGRQDISSHTVCRCSVRQPTGFLCFLDACYTSATAILQRLYHAIYVLKDGFAHIILILHNFYYGLYYSVQISRWVCNLCYFFRTSLCSMLCKNDGMLSVWSYMFYVNYSLFNRVKEYVIFGAHVPHPTTNETGLGLLDRSFVVFVDLMYS